MTAAGPSRVLIVGLGRSGVAAARLAAKDGAEVVVTHPRSREELADVLDKLPRGARNHLGGHPEGCLDGIDLVVVSPGVPPRAPLLSTARDRAITITTEVEFAWDHRPNAPLVAVTGSNGKSTVTVLVDRMLDASGIRSVAGGNLGRPASELVTDPCWHTWVLEISSFQAELLAAMKPRVAVLLNLSQDHLERHQSMQAYASAKRRLFAFQDEADHAILNADDPYSAQTPSAGRRWLFSLEGPADAWLDRDRLVVHDEELVRTDQLLLAGRHNIANALAAALAASAVGANRAGMAEALTTFEGLDHRHRTVLVRCGVRWVDDSKATNIGAAVAALAGYDAASVHLILGGLAKGQDFTELRASVERAAARVYTIGVDGDAIAEILEDLVSVERCGDLREAVRRARSNAVPADIVLLAPACASFDQFADFNERGRVFAELARAEVAPCR